MIAQGTAAELKARVGGEVIEITLSTPHPGAADALAPLVAGVVQVGDDGRHLRAPIRATAGIASEAVRVLDGAGAAVDDIAVHRPSLDDVFFALTGNPVDAEPAHSELAEV